MKVLRRFKYSFVALVLGLLLSFPAFAQGQLEKFFTEGGFGGQLRYRYEYVEQDGPMPVNDDAKASTLRANLSYKSGEYKKINGFIEGQAILHLGNDRFNDTVNGKTSYPVVADPDDLALNQFWLSWAGVPGAEIKLGRQIINIDNQRFIGSVDWRQNDQTFDAAVGSYSAINKNLQLQYGYIWNVNRVFGDDHPLGDLKSRNHFLRGSYHFFGGLNVAAYGYWLDFDRQSASSSRTIGLRGIGKRLIADGLSLNYEAEYAWQQDHASNPVSYNENYYHLAAGLAYEGITAGLGQELLSGDGTVAFQTPLATLHKFNGWADRFLVTPVAGLKDSYATLGYKLTTEEAWLAGTELVAVYHDFRGDSGGDYGHEWNISASRAFELPKGIVFDKAVVTLKYADYTAQDMPYTDTQKVWLQLGVSF
jgi:hypothetical protein